MVASLTIEMLPARHGDALWIEWGDADRRHRMLIDGGPRAAAEQVRNRIERLDNDDRRLDLLIVTHIDLDHIAGVIELLDDASLGLTFDDIWFNDRRHLSTHDPSRGAVQGELLAGQLTAGGHPWNRAFAGGAVVVPHSGALPRVELEGGLILTVLSPTPDTLLALSDEWDATIEEAQRKAEQRALDEQSDPTRGDRDVYGTDSSKANGSSIAVIAEYRGERWLLAGDAHADVLLSGLRRYAAPVGEQRVRLDGFKLAHHGSARNITSELLAAIECRRYLVSTDGSFFKHPDRACLDLIVDATEHPELVFNYRTPFTEPWSEPNDDYTSSYPGAEPLSANHASDLAASPRLPTWAYDSSPEEPVPPQAVPVAAQWSAAPPPTSPTLVARVFHGSLERAAHPVVMGHYRATSLSGAEGFVDRRYDGRLSDRLATDRYPGDIGESILIEAPLRRHPHRGVLVVGLGEYGELTPSRVIETVRSALVRYALDQTERREPASPLELGISSVLLGATGDQGLSVTSSARAVVEGVRDANRTLARRGNGLSVCFTEVELWERNAPEAELAFLSFDQHTTDDRAPTVDLDPGEVVAPTDLIVADGAMFQSLPVESGQARWWRVRVAHHGSSEAASGTDDADAEHLDLEFAVGGRLARTGSLVHRIERSRLERILSDSVASKDPPEGIHATLFELLLPNQLKWDLMAAQDIQLELDDVTADIPWEMLAARNPERGERGQLALRAALVRQLRLNDVPTVRRSDNASALVIGNPPVGALAPPLAGAFREATTVAELLRLGEYAVTELCFDAAENADEATTLAIENALFADDYRIIHIAAHGFLRPDDPSRSGIAIGPDQFLTSATLRQVNVIPDVVFLNCCHLGAVAFGLESGNITFTRRNLHRLGASLARELIHAGVRAVVVAGWAVHDGAAEEFAATFYQEMLRGRTFGWAVHSARLAAWVEAPHHSTWGAYQCYGEGGYSLPQSSNPHRTKTERPRTQREASRRLGALVDRIETVGVEAGRGDDRRRGEAELAAIELAVVERGWTDSGQLCSDLGAGWNALGNLEKAVEWYEHALTADDGRITLAGIEQLANLRDRLAASLVRNRRPSKARRQRADTLVDQSIEAIELLTKLRPSARTSALLGGHHMRRALTLQGAARVAAMAEAASAYRQAYDQAPEAYTLLNYLQLELFRSRIAGDETPIDSLERDLDRSLTEPDHHDYWAAVARPDGELTRALLHDSVEDRRQELVELYVEAFDNRSTWGQRASTIDHLSDLAALHPDAQQAAALRTLHDDLEPYLTS